MLIWLKTLSNSSSYILLNPQLNAYNLLSYVCSECNELIFVEWYHSYFYTHRRREENEKKITTATNSNVTEYLSSSGIVWGDIFRCYSRICFERQKNIWKWDALIPYSFRLWLSNAKRLISVLVVSAFFFLSFESIFYIYTFLMSVYVCVCLGHEEFLDLFRCVSQSYFLCSLLKVLSNLTWFWVR